MPLKTLETIFICRYFTGVEKSKIGSTHFYQISYKNTSKISVKCLTCSETPSLARCGHASVILSKKSSNYILNCLGPSVPYTAVFQLPSNELVTVLDHNLHIHQFLEKKDEPVTEVVSLAPRHAELSQDAIIRIELKLPRRVVTREGEKVDLILILGSDMGNQQINNK